MSVLPGLPLLCGFAFPVAAWLLKRAMERSRDPWGVLLVSNVAAALPFALALAADVALPGTAEAGPSPRAVLSPVPASACLCGAFFFAGQVAGYLSLARGDLSLAIPVQGVKVVLVALFALAFLGQSAGWRLWLAAVLVPASLYFLRGHPPGRREERRHHATVALALSAAAAFAALDTGVQAWARESGFLRFGFQVFSLQALLSLGLWFMPGRAGRFRYGLRTWGLLLAGALGMALITFAIVGSIAFSGRAAWVNVLFNSRVLWGAALPLLVGRLVASPEAVRPGGRRLLGARLVGAGLMLASIALALL